MGRSSGALPAPGVAERRLATGAARTLAILAVPVLAVAGALQGWPGVLGAGIGLGFVLLLFGASASLLAWTAARGYGQVAIALLVGGAVGRLIVYAAALAALSRVEGLHRPSLALAAALAVAVTLAYEIRLLARMPELFWVETERQGASKT